MANDSLQYEQDDRREFSQRLELNKFFLKNVSLSCIRFYIIGRRSLILI